MMLEVDHFFINELVTIIQNGKKYRAITNPDKPITNRRFVSGLFQICLNLFLELLSI